MSKKEYKLQDIIKDIPFAKALIDEEVEVDENGFFLINVGYIRVSTDRQAELGYGLDIQEKDIHRYCVRNEYKNLLLFIDDGYTGTNMDRPALQCLISMIKDYNDGKTNIKICTMIVPRIDRLGRTLLGTLQFIQDYIVSQSDSKHSSINNNKEDISFISIAENYLSVDKSNPQSKLQLMLFASLAEFDRDQIVDKLRKGKVARVASGKWMGGGIIPYGYSYDQKQGTLVIVPEEAEKVKEIFRLYIDEQMSPGKIATLLGFKGDRIVSQILRRKSLTGCIIHKGVEYKGQHEPIITLERWQEAQDEIAKRSVLRGDSSYLLSGLIYCGQCGAKMRYQKWNKQTGECKIVCYSKQKSKAYLVKDENCDNEYYWQSDVENAVLNELFKMEYIGDENNIKESPYLDPIQNLNSRLSAEKRKLAKYYEIMASIEESDESADDIILEKIFDTRKRIQELQKIILDEEERSVIKNKVDKAKKILLTLQDRWDGLTQQDRQAICRELIDKVVIYKEGLIDVHLRLQSFLVKDSTAE